MHKNKSFSKILRVGVIVFTFIILSAQAAFCQVNLPDRQAGLDSLWTVWEDVSQPDTVRVKAIHDYAMKGYMYSKPDSAFYFSTLSYNYASEKGLKKEMAIALNIQGVFFWVKGDYNKALVHYNRSLSINKEIGDKKRIANTLNNIGIIYYNQGDYSSAIDYYTRSLSIGEEIGDKNGITWSLNNIGLIYNNQGDYASALDYYTRSLTIREKLENKEGIASSLNNIGGIYYKKGEYANALDYYTRSITTYEEIGDKRGTAKTLNSIGDVYKKRGEYVSAIDYYTRSLSIREEIGDKKGITGSLINIGIVYKNQDEYTKAIVYSTRALTVAQEVGVVSRTRDAANTLYEIYKATGKNKQSLEMYELYIAARDSIESEENQKEVIRHEYKYEYEKQAVADSIAYVKEQIVQEVKLAKARTQQYGLIGGIFLIIIISVVIARSYLSQKSSNKVLSEQNELISNQKEEIESNLNQLENTNTKLEEKGKELEAFNSVMLDREMRIIDLKKELNKLSKKAKLDIPYPESE